MGFTSLRVDTDDLGRFLTAICEVGVTCCCGAKELFKLYAAWVYAAGGATWSLKGFKGAMIDKGFAQKQSDGMKWLGVQPRDGVDIEEVKRGIWPSGADEAARDCPTGEGAAWAPNDEPPAGWD